MDGEVVVVPDAPSLFQPVAHGQQHLDVLLLGGDGSGELDQARLISEAEEAAVPAVRYLAADQHVLPEPVATTITIGPAAADGPWPRPVIDLATTNPMRFRRATGTTLTIGSFAPGPAFQAAWDDLATSAMTSKVTVEPKPAVASPTDRADLERLHRHLGVLDAPDLHVDAASHAEWLVVLAASGVPIVCTVLPAEVAGRLGEDLAAALAEATVADLADVDGRERTSVRQRCAALREHAASRAWAAVAAATGVRPTPEPTISVLAATNRPEHVSHMVAQHERLSYERRELVVALHGDDFPDDVEDQLRERVSTELTVLRVGAEAPLGDVLNRATEVASGQLVTKLDDDDLYDTHHLDDLLAALRYSGATIVGKGSEFVYVAELDITLRRMPHGAETGSRSVAGGTLMMARDDLLQVGRWQRAPRFIDQLLIEDVLAAGGRLHRTHGHGFVLNRHGRGHTWDSTVDYFLQQSVRQWSGLDLEAAGFWDTTGTLP